ncbi:5-carboxymethyl-2-hydroxymuconate isomerase [Novosphingobium colocasiae]|uniref:5-carboxymethyl-2-hydroxymuconate isomerase n=1 Tax=Novosphingobium colocasiae TaxID=1256513 RepID=A0A918UH59_9SPHN|nr:5-carboxymethyl-2-hydroxymuconate isomerase [Novosphingobium colocasiae]
MKFATFRWRGVEGFGAVVGEEIAPLAGAMSGVANLCDLIAHSSVAEARAAVDAVRERISLADIEYLPVIPNPSKIFCIGVNYETHRVETNRERLGYPIVFLRVADSQVGHGAPMVRPRVSERLDFEGEVALVIGKGGRDISEAAAYEHVFGYSCYNDGSVRDWQFHTSQWAPGKNFARTGAFGPWLVTPDELGEIAELKLETRLNGEIMQSATVDEMIFSIPEQIAYLSTIVELRPGDVIVTGTPGGVGVKRDPQVFMKAGDICEVEVSGIGVLSNPIIDQD